MSLTYKTNQFVQNTPPCNDMLKKCCFCNYDFQNFPDIKELYSDNPSDTLPEIKLREVINYKPSSYQMIY